MSLRSATSNKGDHIDLHVRFKGGQTTSFTIPLPLTGWQARQTDAQAANILNAAGHRSGRTGQAFTPSIVLHLRRCNGLPSHLERLRARGLLTIKELAEQLDVHPSTIKAWQRAGPLTSHQANDKNIRLYDPPQPGDPRYQKRQGIPFRNRLPTPT